MRAINSGEPSMGRALGNDRLSAYSLGELEQMLDNLEQALEVIEKSVYAFQCASLQKGSGSQVRYAAQPSQ
jgi:hypothetical protein